tara:strand:- start:21489 stop:21944 length:456 start_codon:yes stop_codon:yes gene_type:complete
MSFKNLIPLLFFFLVFQPVSAQKDKEQRAITKVVLGYIENFFENNETEMLKYLHPNLAKRGLSKKRGQTNLFFDNMDMNRLKSMLKRKKTLSKKEQKNKVKILDIFHNTASVRLETGYPNRMQWIEYIHLYRLNGKWAIANIFWDYYPKKK